MENNQIKEMVENTLAGDHRSAARLITQIENETSDQREIMKLIYPHTGKSMILGITGSGGAGKSTLTGHLIGKFRELKKTVGVALIDPSSPFSGGALLGDRIRLQQYYSDKGVFIRSLASRGHLGGISKATYDAIRIMEALGVDIIIIETLGTGQDEIEIIHIANTCLLVLTPNMGDEIQAMKAGTMEIADIMVMNKADLPGADSYLRQLENILSVNMTDEGKWTPKIIPTVCVSDKAGNISGIDELINAVGEHRQYLTETKTLEKSKSVRVETELKLIFKDEIENLIAKALNSTGRQKIYIERIKNGETDPYSVVEEVLSTVALSGKN